MRWRCPQPSCHKVYATTDTTREHYCTPCATWCLRIREQPSVADMRRINPNVPFIRGLGETDAQLRERIKASLGPEIIGVDSSWDTRVMVRPHRIKWCHMCELQGCSACDGTDTRPFDVVDGTHIEALYAESVEEMS